jgi:AcrR family transcriptional regulator
MTISAKRKDARRQEILAAAFAIFCEKGYAGATMTDVAQRARASKETLYAWFNNKESLFETLLRARLAEVAGGISPEAASAMDVRSVLTLIARDILKLAISPEMAALGRIAIAEGNLLAAPRRILADAITAERADFVAFLEACRARGALAFADGEQAASMFVAMAQGEWPLRLSLGLIDGISDEDIERHARLTVGMFIKACAPA